VSDNSNTAGPQQGLAGSRWGRSISFRLCIGLLLVIAPTIWGGPILAQETRKVKFSVQPEYPDLAKKNNIQGTVRIQVLVAHDGTIKETKTLGGSPVLVQAATEAAKKWKYEASTEESIIVLKFDFKP
jgi:TonB family protein